MEPLQRLSLDSSVSAVLETLGDTQNLRVALLPSHFSRRLVKESVDDGTSSILASLEKPLLVDLPLRNLLYESRQVQRLYYELDTKKEDLYGKSAKIMNSLLLLDPIRLSQSMAVHMNSAQKQLLMKCFVPKIWVIFLRLVSLDVGSKLRELYSNTVKRIVDDYFLRDMERLQLRLVEMVLSMKNCDPRGYTLEDIERNILHGCREILLHIQQMRDIWGSSVDQFPLLNELIPYLEKCVTHVQNLIDPQPATDGGQEGAQEQRVANVKLIEDSCKAIVAVASKASTLLSLIKLKLLEEREQVFNKPGAFALLKGDVLRRGILGASLEEYEAVPLLILSHCLGAYSIREWTLRFIVERMHNEVSSFTKSESESNSYGACESAYFRTAGQVEPCIKDYLSILPKDVKEYLKELINS
ncbi:conserved hypothetical protein [Theileria equi strain WA]|uniref:Uncharacterized protein n=1 Tax=Theileria equi strain WA TaxID=1537102 RepID=L1LCH6_THEEQ|nr:conserved hypothetical protein [Theileria equi strain WA]EKX72858.1 conserved hypothetical protein [Theileria equi strain WA]|eukprot:XP_004832310.1 conserved hypothetical protein [Theileria equi strain WA]